MICSTYLGSPGNEGGDDTPIAVDRRGDAVIAGTTVSARFPTTPNAFQRTYRGKSDLFVSELDRSGRSLRFSTYLGGTRPELFASGLVVGRSGTVYVDGITCSADFPVTPGAFQAQNAGGGPACNLSVTHDAADVFLTKLNAWGSRLVYSTYLGGTGFDGAGTLRTDPTGRAYVIGGTTSIDFPVTPNALQTTNHGGATRSDGTITVFTADGSGVRFSSYWGGSGDEGIGGAGLDADGNLYLTGCTSSPDYPVTRRAYQREFMGGDTKGFGACYIVGMDAVVTKFGFDRLAASAAPILGAGAASSGTATGWTRSRTRASEGRRG